ncbi:MAG: bifunctional alpha/beta hydrolase/OsmC family protein [Streptosporangiaceae bacterium]
MTDGPTLTFTGSRGKRLTARLDLPPGRPRTVVLVAHCFSGGNAGFATAQLARSLTELAMAVLCVDLAPSGSGNDPASATFGSGLDDLVAAVGQLRSTVTAPTVLVGHSLGGAAVLAMASRVPEARAVVTIAAPADLTEVAAGKAPGSESMDEVSTPTQRQRIAALGRALLVIHSPSDEVVGIDNARIIFDAARHPKSFISLDGADHLLSRHADATYAAGVIAAWAARYLPAPDNQVIAPAPIGPPPRDVVVVAESNARPYGQDITADGHQLLADEPAQIGGAGTGPGPYELLLAALGACTSITVRMYAERKGWPLRHTTVRLRHRRIHASDCAACETKTGWMDHIERELQFDGELTDQQRAALLVIAERCPVHRTLHSQVTISTTEAAPGDTSRLPPPRRADDDLLSTGLS